MGQKSAAKIILISVAILLFLLILGVGGYLLFKFLEKSSSGGTGGTGGTGATGGTSASAFQGSRSHISTIGNSAPVHTLNNQNIPQRTIIKKPPITNMNLKIESKPNTKTTSLPQNTSKNKNTKTLNNINSTPILDIEDEVILSGDYNNNDHTPLDDIDLSMPPKFNNKKPQIKNENYEIPQFDDEINSSGEHLDLPFKVNSGTSDDEFVNSPFEKQSKGYKVKKNCDCLSITTFSIYVVFLHDDGRITFKNSSTNEKFSKKSNVKLSNLFTYDGYLHGISQNVLFYLPNNQLQSREWEWNKVSWTSLNKLNHASVILTSSFLWLQDDNFGYLFNKHSQVEKVKLENKHVKRIYGKSINHYIELYSNKGVLFPSGMVYKDIKDAVLDANNKVYTIKSDSEFDRIFIVNWEPYYC